MAHKPLHIASVNRQSSFPSLNLVPIASAVYVQSSIFFFLLRSPATSTRLYLLYALKLRCCSHQHASTRTGGPTNIAFSSNDGETQRAEERKLKQLGTGTHCILIVCM